LTVGAQALISNLAAQGITLTPNGDSLIVRLRGRLTDADREAIRQSKPALLAHLRAGMELRRERTIASDSRHPFIEADREQAEIDRIARLDAERREADRQANRGYDVDPSAPSHIEREEAEIDRLASIDGWKRLPAHSIIATCHRYGVALRIDEATGELVVGRAGAKAYEPSQPWPSLLIAIETHLEAVAALVEEGMDLESGFPTGRVKCNAAGAAETSQGWCHCAARVASRWPCGAAGSMRSAYGRGRISKLVAKTETVANMADRDFPNSGILFRKDRKREGSNDRPKAPARPPAA
jgi:hypothetical protein